jgi:HEPN domain-containing protein
LAPGDDPNAGHVTFILLDAIWYIAFDFRYNRDLATRHLGAAAEFLEAARHSHKENHQCAFVDNLFSAVELVAKATLLFIPDAEFRRKSSHKAIHSRYNRFAHLGNVSASYRDTFNRLSRLRRSARYLEGTIDLHASQRTTLIDTVDAMIDEQREWFGT